MFWGRGEGKLFDVDAQKATVRQARNLWKTTGALGVAFETTAHIFIWFYFCCVPSIPRLRQLNIMTVILRALGVSIKATALILMRSVLLVLRAIAFAFRDNVLFDFVSIYSCARSSFIVGAFVSVVLLVPWESHLKRQLL
jgi:hypothetical protein